MVEYCRYRYRSGNSPSGVPFLEMLESILDPFLYRQSPSGVPFLEMLESLADALPVGGSPSGVPFLEMLECLWASW